MPPPGSSSGSTAIKPAALGPIIFVLGAPGSGKGTLCSRVVEQLPDSFRHLSVGDYLRELRSNGGFERLLQRSDVHGNGALSSEEVEIYLQENKLLPPDTIIPLIKYKLLNESSPPGIGWLIDGFPRDIETARTFEKKIKKPDQIIVLLCRPHIAKERFLERKRTITDDEMLFEKRWGEYEQNMEAVREHYKSKNILVSTNEQRDRCWNNLVRALWKLPEFGELKLDEYPF